jgi:hypothetical protein
MMKTGKMCFAGVFVLLAACSMHAAVVSVSNMSVGGYSTMPYFAGGVFSISKTGGYVDVKMYGATTTDYKITTSSLTFSPCSLLSDTSSGGVASGTFDGSSAVLTVVGSIRNKVTNTVLTSGTLLTAAMVPTTWSLNETLTDNVASGSIAFTPTGGLLVTGIAEGSNTIEIGNFNLSFLLKTVNISDFQGASYTAAPPNIQIVAAEVPEPATLAILGLGSLLLARRKK